MLGTEWIGDGMPELILHNFLLDVVQPMPIGKVQMITYKVLASSPDHAVKRFFNEEAGIIVFQGEVVDRILVGMNIDQRGSMDVPSR